MKNFKCKYCGWCQSDNGVQKRAIEVHYQNFCLKILKFTEQEIAGIIDSFYRKDNMKDWKKEFDDLMNIVGESWTITGNHERQELVGFIQNILDKQKKKVKKMRKESYEKYAGGGEYSEGYNQAIDDVINKLK